MMASVGVVAAWESDARSRLIVAADSLAHRLGRPAFNREARTSRDPVPTAKSCGDLELLAVTAEAVAALAAEIDALQIELAALKGAR
jgi:hypothetical protein